jgi:glycerol-3-phosphate dehydrogenase
LFLDAKASIEAAPVVAELIGGELGRDRAWQVEQVESFGRLAAGYLPG